MGSDPTIRLIHDDERLIDAFVASHQQRTSRETYSAVVRPLLAWHQQQHADRPETPLAELSRQDAVRYYRTHINPQIAGEPTRSAATVRRDLSILSALFSYLGDHDLRDRDRPDPFRIGGALTAPPRPLAHTADRPHLDGQQLQHVITIARDLGPDEFFVVAMIAFYGQPIHGLQDLIGEDVPPSGNGRPVIHLRARRGTRSWHPLIEQLHDPVEQLRPDDPTQPLLRSPRGLAVHRRAFASMFRQITRNAELHQLEIPPVTSGLLHQTFLVNATRSGITPDEIQKLTGQQDTSGFQLPTAPGTSTAERIAANSLR